MWNVEDFNNDLFEVEKEKEKMEVEKDFSMDKPSYLLEYVRKNKNNRNKKGVLLAVKQDGDKVVIGWSLCRPNDEFDKYFGQEVAYDRGMKRFDDPHHFEDIPPSIFPQVERFVDRCEKYFKDCELPLWI